ncbi:MAG: alpha/beta fold hydrolase [Actinobacteria bacterium]|nr:alpha/beta fold hydrolase [Actinomycetota bacterium]MCB9413445.1 alpha/beta fold hydrolase [Actinomycetota bacterium]
MPRSAVLILFHGVGDDGRCWQPFLRAADLRGVSVVTPDAPAHGGRKSAPGRTPHWRDQLAEAVAEVTRLVADNEGEPVLVGGHSMGAAIATGVASLHPNLVAGLFLEDPPFFEREDGSESESGPATLAASLHPWFVGLQTASLEQVVATVESEHPEWPADEYLPWAAAKLAVDADAFAEPVEFIGARWWQWSQQVRCPVLTVAGQLERGSLLGTEQGERLARLPQWEVVRLDAGHDVRRDARGATVAALGEFTGRR